MSIKNRSQLELVMLDNNQLLLRKIALDSIEIALNSVKPENLIKKNVDIVNDKLIIQEDVYDLKQFRDVYIIGCGKASAGMLLSLEEILNKSPN